MVNNYERAYANDITRTPGMRQAGGITTKLPINLVTGRTRVTNTPTPVSFQITACRRHFHEKLTVAQLAKQTQPPLQQQNDHCRLYKGPPQVRNVSQLNPVKIFVFNSFKMHLNIIIQSVPRPGKWSIPFQLYD